MYVRDLEGNEQPIQVTSTNNYDLNGKQGLKCTIESNEVNDLFINDIAEMWIIADHDGVEHKINYCKKKGKGNGLTVDIKAIPIFFDKFNSDRVYEVYDEHMTADEYFSIVFANTGYDYVLSDAFDAVQWQGVGKGATKLKLFKDGLDRYKCEFRIVGNLIYLESQIGRDTNFQYRYRLNASNIQQEIDGSALWTYAKGFGDYAEGDEANAGLVREYTSPLAGILGIRHAPPIYDGRVTNAEKMDESLKELVEESLKVSVSSDIHDLRKQGYELAQPELGDRVFLIDERIGLDTEVRINNISLVRDWKGNVIDMKLVFGAPLLVKRHQSNLKAAVDRLTALYEGREQLPFSALDAAVQIATKALQNAQTELQFPANGGILAVDKNDPNLQVIFNSAGIGVSSDGGNTFPNAITGNGIVAEAVIAGTLRGMTIRGSEIYGGLFETTGSDDRLVKIFDGTVQSKGSLYNAGYVNAKLDSGIMEFVEESIFASGGYEKARMSSSGIRLFGMSSLSDPGTEIGVLEVIQNENSPSTWKTRLRVSEVVTDTGTY